MTEYQNMWTKERNLEGKKVDNKIVVHVGKFTEIPK